MEALLIIALVVLIILVALALSQASDVNKRLNAYLRDLHRVQGLESRLGALERALKRLEETGRRGAGETIAAPDHAGAPAVTAPRDSTTAGAAAPAPSGGAEPAAGPAAAPPSFLPPPLQPAPPSRSRAEWEAFVGGKLLNRIGALALILGVGFFLKYAFDNDWISETVRVLIGAAAGLLCLAVARRTRAKGMAIFAQGLVGSGIAILYLSVYASFNYYSLVSLPAAFGLMSIVTALTFAQGVSHQSLAVGLLGWAGGFLTPFLLSTGDPNATGLLGYVTALDIAILALSIRQRGWDVLSPLAMAATWFVYGLWHYDYPSPDRLYAALPFICGFWLLFHVDDVARGGRRTSLRMSNHLQPAANVAVFWFFLHDLLESNHHGWSAPATVALAGLYLATIFLVRRPGPVAEANRARNAVILSALVVVATSIQFEGFTTVIFWSAEAALLAFLGFRLRHDHLMAASIILFLLALVKHAGTGGAFSYSFPGEFGPVTNVRNLAYLALAASLGFGAGRHRRFGGATFTAAAGWLSAASAVVVFALATVTVNDMFSFVQAGRAPGPLHDLMFRRLMAIGCTWAVYSIPFAWAGLARDRITLLVSGLFALLFATALVTLRGVSFEPVEAFHPLTNSRVAAFAVVLCAMVLHSSLIDAHRGARDWLGDVRPYIGIAAGVAVFFLLTGETRDVFQRLLLAGPEEGSLGPDRAVQLRNLQQLSISGVWLVYSGALMAVGIWKGSRGLRLFSIGVFGLSILKIFIYDLSFLETLYRIFSFLGLGLILLAVSYAYQRYRGVLFPNAGGGPAPPPPR